MCFTPERLTVDVTMRVSRFALFCGLCGRHCQGTFKKSLIQSFGLKEMILISRYEGTEMLLYSFKLAVNSSSD